MPSTSSGPRIKCISRSFSAHPILRRELLDLFPNAILNDQGLNYEGAALVEYLKNCDGAIVSLEPVDDALLAQLPELRIISKYGVGIDNLDTDAMKRRNVALGWTGGLNKQIGRAHV